MSEHISDIIVHPTDSNIVWVSAQGPLWSKGGQRGLFKTTDGGNTWKNVLKIDEWTDVTSLVIDSRNPDKLYAASWQRQRTLPTYVGTGPGTAIYTSDDGGIYESRDGMDKWRFISNLPITQFYKIAVDDSLPFYNVYGGTQDNSSQGGPSRTIKSHGIKNNDWFLILDWDGHQPATEPGNPDIIYALRLYHASHRVWRIVQDHVNKDLLFIGTEFGLFFTVNGGKRWTELTGDAPTISFRDVKIQRRESDLVAGSFGRGIFILDDYSPLRSITEDSLKQEALLFASRTASWYIPDSLHTDSQGDFEYQAENPEFGATFIYYLRDGIRSTKDKREYAEKKLVEKGTPLLYSEWDKVASLLKQ